MYIQSVCFPKARLALAVAVTLAVSNPVWGRETGPGSDHTVSDAVSPESWYMTGGRLLVTPGGVTEEIHGTAGAALTMTGGEVNATDKDGVRLENSTATIANARIVSTGAIGLSAASALGGVGSGSTATVSNSYIEGVGRGVNASLKSTVTLTDSTVVGHAVGHPGNTFDNGGVGLAIVGGQAELLRSSVTGDEYGAVVLGDINGVAPTLMVDSSQIVGQTGSAIRVGDDQEPIDAKITVQNGSTLTGGNGVILEVRNDSRVDFSVSNSQLLGDVVVDIADGAVVDATLSNNASLTGQLINLNSLAINSGAAWNMVGDATLKTLTLGGGSVNLGGGNGQFRQLNLGELSGDGVFKMGVDLGAGQGDFLNVTGAASGNHSLGVTNTGVDPQGGEDALQMVHTGGGDAAFGVIGGQVDLGTFAYQLEKRDNGLGGYDWFLVQSGGKPGEPGEILTPSAQSVIALFSAAPTVWYGELSTLRSRMGELRTTESGEQRGGGWMRSYGNKYNVSVSGKVDYQQNQRGIVFGVDTPVPNNYGQWLVGVMGGYSNSDLNLKRGTQGDVDSFYLGAYTTWLDDQGFYIDALIKANRFQNSSKVVMSDGSRAKGKYNNYGIGASVEAGKHIALQDNWFVEPYAQLSALWVSGDTYELDNSMRGSSNKTDSLLGKVGAHVGRKFMLDDGGFVQPYVKVAVGQEFAKNNQVRVNGNKFNNDQSGGRGEIGGGIAAQLTDVLQVHADIDYSKGDNIEQPWGVNVGLRYSF